MMCSTENWGENIQTINKSEVTRNDSTDLDLSFVDLGKQLNESMHLAQGRRMHEQSWGIPPTKTQKDKDQEYDIPQHHHVPRRSSGHERLGYQPRSQLNIHQSVLNDPTLNDLNRVFDGSHTTHEPRCSEISSDFTELSQDQLISTTRGFTSKTDRHLFENARKNKYNPVRTGSDCKCLDQIRQKEHANSPDDPIIYYESLANKNTSHEKCERRKREPYAESGNNIAFSVLSTTHPAILIYVVSVIVMAVVMIHLYMKVHSLEAGGRTRCFCDEPSLPTTASHETRVVDTDVISADVRTFPRLGGRRERDVIARRVRAERGQAVRDRRSKKDVVRALLKECKSEVESFEGNFSKLFDYTTHFVQQGSITLEHWGPGVTAHRNSTIFIPKTNTLLQIFKETQQTAKKINKNKLVLINEKHHGAFQVQKPGHYMISFNITMVDISGNHSLAVYLNGQAVLECVKGGFRCPHYNEEGFNMYRICNIFGILELNKNDTLDVRTMQNNTTIRLHKQRVSFFTIILPR